MKKPIIRILIAITLVFTSCASNKKIESEDEFSVEADGSIDAEANNDAEAIEETSVASDNEDLNLEGAENSESDIKNEVAKDSQDQSLENELNSLSTDPKTTKSEDQSSELSLDEAGGPELSLDQPKDKSVVDTSVKTEVSPVSEINPLEVPEPQKLDDSEVSKTEVIPTKEDDHLLSQDKIATINNVVYKSNDNGGTVAISANQPLTYTTRLNSSTNQFVVEVENSIIPQKLKRELNTKDMASSIGSVDIYQKSGSNITRFVVQLRPGATEPMVQPEGNSLLIIGSAATDVSSSNSELEKSSGDTERVRTADQITKEGLVSKENVGNQSSLPQESQKLDLHSNNEIVDLNSEGIMGASDLESFLISNNKYYGKKITIETGRMDLKTFFNFLAEESGVNLILDDGVTGEVALKLVNVPWDQAFVLVLKAKKLAYKRQGTVLRVGTVKDFLDEEVEAVKLKESRKDKEPIVVKRFFIGYTKIAELELKINKLMESLGSKIAAQSQNQGFPQLPQNATISDVKVLSDLGTNSIIVSGTEKNIEIVAKFIKALDVQPQQVLIESKIVEAQESFSKSLGVNWNSTTVGSAPSVNSAKIGMQPLLSSGDVLTTDVTWGSLNILGSLTAQLKLGEREDKVKILSSPRVAVLSNESATIEQKSSVNILKTVTNGDGSKTTTPETKNFGITLRVTPVVSNEGTVTLNLDLTREFLPRVDSVGPDSRVASTKLIVRSGQTAVVGGIFESQSREAVSGVTGLKDIPILGGLFKGSGEDKFKNELVMFVTPTILKPVVGAEKTGDSVF